MIESLEKECWNLDTNMANLLLPKLLYFKNWTERYGCPVDLEVDEWEEILTEICWAFMYAANFYDGKAGTFISDVEMFDVDKPEEMEGTSLVTKTINITYSDEVAYHKAVEQDRKDLARCQIGINLFAQYYMSLWN